MYDYDPKNAAIWLVDQIWPTIYLFDLFYQLREHKSRRLGHVTASLTEASGQGQIFQHRRVRRSTIVVSHDEPEPVAIPLIAFAPNRPLPDTTPISHPPAAIQCWEFRLKKSVTSEEI
jgi:hypothetical protein